MKTLSKVALVILAVGLAGGGSARAGSMVNNREPKKAGYRTVAVYADTHMYHPRGLTFRSAHPVTKK